MSAGPVIVTRPAHEAAAWVRDFQSAGLDAVALPLIAIAPALDVAPLRAAWARLADYAALMFVSATAVEHFFMHAEKGPRAAGPRFWATGPGTARALLRAGVPQDAIDAPPSDAAAHDQHAHALADLPFHALPQGLGVEAGGVGRRCVDGVLRHAGAH